jgi:hypothetical protein
LKIFAQVGEYKPLSFLKKHKVLDLEFEWLVKQSKNMLPVFFEFE